MNTKEFFTKWGQGIKAITPMQITKINLMGSIIIVVGVLFGLYATYFTGVWWLFTILIGSLIITTTALLGTIQKLIVLSDMQRRLKVIQNEYQSTGV